MNPDIQNIRDEIERLENDLRNAMHSCPHDNANLYWGRTSGGYYDDPENYVYIDCPDCGIKYTYYDDDREYHIFKNIDT